jgi:hypothetical protein
LSPEALYLLRAYVGPPEQASIDARLRVLGQAEALQHDFPKLASLWGGPDPVWLLYGEEDDRENGLRQGLVQPYARRRERTYG